MVGKGTYRTKEEKARIVMEVLSNSSTIAEISRKLNVTSSAVYEWRNDFISVGAAAINIADPSVRNSFQEK
ncbi:MAG: transposase [Candidatus Thermoplasmatota archaeon]|nr:transposase [Candidatus Thermoplasmatota archaeon]